MDYDAASLGFKFLFVPISIIIGAASLSSALRPASHFGGTSSARRRSLSTIVAIAIIYHLHAMNESTILSSRGMGGSGGMGPHRLDCLRSRKGGKRPHGDVSEEYRHPCHNGTYEGDDDAYVESYRCPSSGAGAAAGTTIGTPAPPYISASRDCREGQSNRCTLSQPCVPCEIDRRLEFEGRWSRCRACSMRNRYGNCDFVDGLGPYCFATGRLVEVVPCRRCCTERDAMYDEDGVCY